MSCSTPKRRVAEKGNVRGKAKKYYLALRVWRFFRFDTNVPQPYVSIGKQLLLSPLVPERKNKNGIPDITGKPLDNIMNCDAIHSQNGKKMSNCNEITISSHGKENMNYGSNPGKGQCPAFIQGGEQRRRRIT